MARLTGTVTQGANDAFAIAEVQTALQGQTRNAYRIAEITAQLVLPANQSFPTQSASALQSLQIALSRRTKTAMPNITDVDLLKLFELRSAFATAVGYGNLMQGPFVWQPPSDMIVVEDPLYLMIDSNGTAVTWGAVVTIEYEVVTISEVDRLTLLTQSLQ